MRPIIYIFVIIYTLNTIYARSTGDRRVVRSPYPPPSPYGGFPGYGFPSKQQVAAYHPYNPHNLYSGGFGAGYGGGFGGGIGGGFGGGYGGGLVHPPSFARPPVHQVIPGGGFGGPSFGGASSSASASSNSFGPGGIAQSNSQAQSETGTIHFGPLQASYSKTQSSANAQSVGK